MREILFRGKSETGDWGFGYYVKRQFCGGGEQYRIVSIDGSFVQAIRGTVGQWTGLRDRNGARIYEGDIVETSKYGYENGKGQNYSGKDRFVVHFSDGTYVLENKRRRFCLRPDSSVEVVGNIHDNPELLEEELT